MNSTIAWIILLVAGLLEVVWAISLKYTDGFSQSGPSTLALLAMIASIMLLGIASKAIPIGTAYAVWVGVGVVGTTLFGVILFGESTSALRMVSVGLVLVGIVGLKLSAPQS